MCAAERLSLGDSEPDHLCFGFPPAAKCTWEAWKRSPNTCCDRSPTCSEIRSGVINVVLLAPAGAAVGRAVWGKGGASIGAAMGGAFGWFAAVSRRIFLGNKNRTDKN